VSGEAIYDLACRAGILVNWVDAADRPQRVPPATLRRVLDALGYSCATEKDVQRSLGQLSAAKPEAPEKFLVCDVGAPVTLADVKADYGRLVFEDGAKRDIRLQRDGAGHASLTAISQLGYHELHVDDRVIVLAVAPKRCFTFADVAPDEKLWGVAAQVYGLKRDGDGGIGDTVALSMLAREAAAKGADAIAISPIHALFTARPDKFSPYSPSTRLFLNPLFADPSAISAQDGTAALQNDAQVADVLIDWPSAASRKMALLREVFDNFRVCVKNGGDTLARRFLAFRQAGGEMLENHARFEAIHAAMVRRDLSNDGYRTWPETFSRPENSAVSVYAAEHETEITFHIFLQWLADESLRRTQNAAHEFGMRIGLIGDLAVGMEPSGSYAWSRPDDVLPNLTIGAPADVFNEEGQNWGLTALSPRALVERGHEPFIETLRAAMRHVGGVRIDHILGLKRLWMIPSGASPRDGAYLTYPLDDLLRLLRLESLRHRAIVIGEDLGTVPAGFRATLSLSGIAGMDVLWFSRDKNGFLSPEQWRRDAVALTSTHDLPTVTGWWQGADIRFRAENGLLSDRGMEEPARKNDREALTQAFAEADVVAQSPEHEERSFVSDAIAFVAKSPAPLVLVPLEDMLGLEEQPNVPGTTDQHPNWRRRYPVAADRIFDSPLTLSRAKSLSRRRDG
jgi:4-alpha-glucanotransferase